MQVSVVYTTQVKAALDLPGETIEVAAGSTASDLLKQLVEKHGSKFGELVFTSEGKLLPSLLMCVGDEQLASPADYPLQEGDALTLLSAISGG